MKSFYVFFYILDQSYDQCQEDHLGGFLGAISPELWEDGLPADIAIYNDWKTMNDFEAINEKNIVKKIYDFLEHYEYEYGFDFSKTKQWLLTSINRSVIEKAEWKAQVLASKVLEKGC